MMNVLGAADPVDQHVADRPRPAVVQFLEIVPIGDVQSDRLGLARRKDLPFGADPIPRTNGRITPRSGDQKGLGLIRGIGIQVGEPRADRQLLAVHVAHVGLEGGSHRAGFAQRRLLFFGAMGVIPDRIDAGLHDQQRHQHHQDQQQEPAAHVSRQDSARHDLLHRKAPTRGHVPYWTLILHTLPSIVSR